MTHTFASQFRDRPLAQVIGYGPPAADETRIFVFGSNLAGIHGAGAAAYAEAWYGAVYGCGLGVTGKAYAIPTKDGNIDTLPLDRIKEYVEVFMGYARYAQRYGWRFQVTRIGCGLAGYTDEQIAPLFKGCPSNCDLPEGWREIAEKERVL